MPHRKVRILSFLTPIAKPNNHTVFTWLFQATLRLKALKMYLKLSEIETSAHSACKECVTMNTPTTTASSADTSATDDGIVLLEEVDFKWLMAGQGWWVDTERLHTDRSYAADLLKLANTIASPALHDCAEWLQSH